MGVLENDWVHNLGTYNGFSGTEIYPMSTLKFSSKNSSFEENDTIQSIVDRLFIDSWLSEISYERYYNACTPEQCTYSYGRRLNIMYVLMKFFGGYSSLSTVLCVLVPGLIFILRKMKNWCARRRVE